MGWMHAVSNLKPALRPQVPSPLGSPWLSCPSGQTQVSERVLWKNWGWKGPQDVILSKRNLRRPGSALEARAFMSGQAAVLPPVPGSESPKQVGVELELDFSVFFGCFFRLELDVLGRPPCQLAEVSWYCTWSPHWADSQPAHLNERGVHRARAIRRI